MKSVSVQGQNPGSTVKYFALNEFLLIDFSSNDFSFNYFHD